VDSTGKAAAATDPTKAMKGWAAGRFQPGRGPRRIQPDRGDDADDGKNLKDEALLGISADS
jgi:hypothetical protein